MDQKDTIPLHKPSAHFSDIKLLKKLLKRGANPHIASRKGVLPVHKVVSNVPMLKVKY
jgi:hypothetical protein